MAFSDPASLDLGGLFRDPDMFDSKSSWAAAGFQIVNGSKNGKIMVACQASVPGLLFKKYTDAVSQRDQRANFECRLEGAQRLRAFVEERALTRIIVPRKWIIELPRKFSRRATVLVVERLDLLEANQSAEAYHDIDPALLRELCTVLFHYRGMDSSVYNLPFLTGNRIGLIDTEHWDRDYSKDYLHHVGEHLSHEGRKAAKKIFHQLREKT